MDLLPDRMYEIGVTPVNSAGSGPVAVLVINTTLGIPEDSPKNVKV